MGIAGSPDIFQERMTSLMDTLESVYPRKLQHLLIVCLSVCQSHFNIIGRKSTYLGSTLGRTALQAIPLASCRRSNTPTMRPRFSWWISGIRRQSSNGPQKYNNMHIQRTFYAHDSCPYGQLVVLLGDYKGGGMMIVRCSTAPLMIITLVHLISMRTFHYIFIFGIHRNTKSCPLPCWCIDGGIIQYIN